MNLDLWPPQSFIQHVLGAIELLPDLEEPCAGRRGGDRLAFEEPACHKVERPVAGMPGRDLADLVAGHGGVLMLAQDVLNDTGAAGKAAGIVRGGGIERQNDRLDAVAARLARFRTS